MKFKAWNFFIVPSQDLQDESGLVPSISKLLFQLFLAQNVRNERHTKNGQLKKGLQLKSMLPSMTPMLLQKKLDQRPEQSMKLR